MTRLDLVNLELKMCRGCRTCFDKGEEKCPLKDDLLLIRDNMKESDLWIWATPVYVDDVNAPMKNLIDRLAFVCHRPEFGGKRAFILTTAGSLKSSHTVRTMQVAFWTWGVSTIDSLSLVMGGKSDSRDLEQHHSQRIDSAVAKCLKSLERWEPTFIQLMIFRIQQLSWGKEREDSLDKRYWEGTGLLGKRRTFLVEHKANPLKVMFARAFGSFVHKLTIR